MSGENTHKKSDSAVRKSERIKERDFKDDKDYSLPPPGHTVDSSTPNKGLADEKQLDRKIEILERSIRETEESLVDMERRKKIEEKEKKIERLQKQLLRNEKKIEKVKEEGEDLKNKVNICPSGPEMAKLSSENITVQTLRKNESLKRQAHKKMVNLGLISSDSADADSSISSDSNSDFLVDLPPTKSKHKGKHLKRKSFYPKSTSDSSTSDSDSSDSESRSKTRKKKKNKKSKKSGIAKKASDKVKFPQVWPHLRLQYEFVSENISFKKLDLKNFVAGELEILTSRLTKVEYKGRISFLKKIVYYSNIYEWKRLLQFYAAWLRRIEMGLNSWADDPSQIETAMLTGQVMQKSTDKNSKSKSDRIWWCYDFNHDKCSISSNTHQKTVKGRQRLVKHICSTCWQNDKKQLQHPETSSACPYKI